MSITAATTSTTTRSFDMLQHSLSEALARERMRESEQQVRREYVRRLAVLRRRQRRVEAARRALHALSA
jgi:hypothetical protein